MLSVCLATYNGARYLREQIDSILPQLGAADELVLSDDGSSDTTLDIIASYGGRVRLVGTARAGGVVANFERALSSALGDLIVLSDQDDVWLPGRLELIRERLEHSSMLMMNAEVVGADGQPIGQDVYELVGFRGGFLPTLIQNKYVGCCLAFRRELLVLALPFPRHIQWHDWYLALIAELLFDVEAHPRKTLLFRRHGNNASPTGLKSSTSLLSKLRARAWMSRALVVVLLRRLRNRRSTTAN
jgi:glycosyltransferase involved in cell wall biosynthesis